MNKLMDKFDLDTIGYFLYMEQQEQEQRESEDLRKRSSIVTAEQDEKSA